MKEEEGRGDPLSLELQISVFFFEWCRTTIGRGLSLTEHWYVHTQRPDDRTRKSCIPQSPTTRTPTHWIME
jgi:hypothetical protein